MSADDEKFVSRWSRLKSEAREKKAEEAAAAPPAAPDPAAPPPELPPVEQLTIDSDFRGFLHPKVDEDLRRTALKKLFADPHFNVMDGLDVYIDDYSKPSPLPAAMLAQLKQTQNILDWARERKAEEHAREKGGAAAEPPARLDETPPQPQAPESRPSATASPEAPPPGEPPLRKS